MKKLNFDEQFTSNQNEHTKIKINSGLVALTRICNVHYSLIAKLHYSDASWVGLSKN